MLLSNIDMVLDIVMVFSIVFALLIVVSYLNSVAYNVCRRGLTLFSVYERSVCLFVMAILAPLQWMISLLLLFFAPSLGFFNIYEHCHEANCGPHHPIYFGYEISLTAITLVMALIAFSSHATSRKRLQRFQQQVTMLIALSHKQTSSSMNTFIEYHVIDNGEPKIFSAGWHKPIIFMSSGMLKQLDKNQLNALLLKEYAAIVRRVAFKTQIIRFCCYCWPSRSKHQLLQQFLSVNEKIGDTVKQETLNYCRDASNKKKAEFGSALSYSELKPMSNTLTLKQSTPTCAPIIVYTVLLIWNVFIVSASVGSAHLLLEW